MKKTTEFLAGFFQGKQSMTRLVLLIATVFLWGTWSYTSIVNKKPQELSSSLVTAYALAVGGKAAQNYFDRKAGITPTETTPPEVK